MSALARRLLLLILAGTGAGCGDEVQPPIVPSPAPALFIVDSLGETLSRHLLETGATTPGALALGAAPNDIVVAPGGVTGYVVSSLSNRIDVVDLDRLLSERTIDLGAGSNPYALALAGGAGAYVSNWLPGEVAHVDLGAGTVRRRIPVGAGPEGLVFVAGDAGAGDLFVAVTQYAGPGFGVGEVVVVSVPADTVRARIAVGTNPQALAPADDGMIHVVCSGDYGPRTGWVYVIDPALPAAVDSLAVGGSPVAILPLAGGRGFVAGYAGGLRAYDLGGRTAAEASALRGGSGFTSLAYDAITDRLYVADFDDDCVHVVAVAADTLVGSFAVGDGPVDVALRR